MARYTLRTVEVAKVSGKMPSNCRYRLEDVALKASVKKLGVLVPLIVTGGESPVLVTGHRRFVAARECGLREVPALEAGELSGQDAFILNLVSNWRQEFSEMDRAFAIARAAGELGFRESEVRKAVMPLLGLSEDAAVLEFYREVHGCPAAFKDLIEDGILPFRGISFFLQLSRADQEYFAKVTGKTVRLTSSQLLQIGEWLVDLVKSGGKDLETLFREHKLPELLDVPGMDPRTGADKLFSGIRRIRFPGYTGQLEKFDDHSAFILRDAKNLSLRPVEGFEERGFEIRARVRTPEELDILLKKLSQERSALNSLFDVML